jgi:3,5-epimerase/4-reductase
MNKKILIIGPGFIGTRIHEGIESVLSSSMINSIQDALAELEKQKPDVLINCIGFTGGRNVDGCEDDIDATLKANTFVPLMLAEACVRRGVKFVHISSGCIYHYDYAKDTPLTEDRAPDFFELYYSRTKVYTERALDAMAPKYRILIPRIRIPLDNRPHPRNILTKLLSFKQVIDIPNSITYLPDMLEALKYLIASDAYGIYNVVNKNGLRYAELLDVYRQYVPDYSYKMIPHTELHAVRTNLLLSTRKLEESGFKVRAIQEVLEECVRQYVQC